MILCCAAYLYFLAQRFQFELVPGRVGPDAWPKIVLGLLLVTCVWQLGRILIVGAAPAASADDELPLSDGGGDYTHLALLAIGVTVVYAYVLPALGFFVATVLYMGAIAYVSRFRQVVPLLATSIIAPLVLMFVFMKIVYVALPLGAGPFKALTLALLKMLGVH
ncbi:MAG TPA: tripartite tricarboxylate transporter TctB family protein [Candidatus Baltobacteraceae bacterium]